MSPTSKPLELIDSVTLDRMENGRWLLKLPRPRYIHKKQRGHRLIEALGVCWCKRNNGYVIKSNAVAQTWIDLYTEGWDADYNGNFFEPGDVVELVPPKPIARC